ncbi:hypothetical protein W02_04590 [Nitrospira sp. KM1]|uniref:caspase family protein n=1 Tax=Nitrospira sp. KM1 TaxID=1936990 RepID=UPI0013A74581|nr:caspase family protein [Nitrospira sp. KM1]BCA53319.1 hypothetical protein W02_04590 [Nitrospira sp. KM1]
MSTLRPWKVVMCVLVLVSSVVAGSRIDLLAMPAQGKSGNKRALLIGINNYRAVPKLQGSLNDVETMKQVLMTRWGFPEVNIRTLTDEQATREGMLAALSRLVDDTGPDDIVYIHYSGHGSQVEDLNGDEPDDRLDETLVPQDGRTGSVPDITDDELEALLSRLTTPHAFVVLDSCHSGTATRSLDIRTRSVPQDMRTALYKRAGNPEIQTRGAVRPLAAQYVLMAGAASHQEALDGPVNGRYHGFFSYALSRSLTSSPAGASPRAVFRIVETELQRIQTHFGRISMPEPQLEAPVNLLEQPLLGTANDLHQETHSTSVPRLVWLEVQPGDQGTVTLLNGLLLGAAPGSVWSIYPPGDSGFAPGGALAVASVIKVAGQHAYAKVRSPSKAIPDRSRAVPLLPPSPPGGRVPIRILEMPERQRRQIEHTLAKNIPNVDLVGPNQSARYLVGVEGDSVKLLTADGLGLVGSFGGSGDDWGAGVALVVSRSTTASELLTLDNPSSQLKVDMRVASENPQPVPKAGTRGIVVVAADTQPAKYKIRTNGAPRTAENSLQLQVTVNADAYVTIVDVDSEGSVNVLFPNAHARTEFHPDGRIRANERVLIPDSLSANNKAGFYWDYSPPKGTDTVRVFSSTDLETATMIRQKIKDLQTPQAKNNGKKITARAIDEGIASIRRELENTATRGFLTVYDPTSHVPGQKMDGQPEVQAASPSSLAGSTPSSLDPASAPPMPLMQGMPANQRSDWAAATVTIQVE